MSIYDEFIKMYGITHKQAAELLHVHPGTIRRWRKGGAMPKAQEMCLVTMLGYNKKTIKQVKRELSK